MQFNLEGLEYEALTKMNFKELPREGKSCICQINLQGLVSYVTKHANADINANDLWIMQPNQEQNLRLEQDLD